MIKYEYDIYIVIIILHYIYGSVWRYKQIYNNNQKPTI